MAHHPDPTREQIYASMEVKETGELLEIWNKQDRSEWTDETFSVVAELLRQRLGYVPALDEPQNAAPEDDTFYDLDRVTRISTWAKDLAWVILGAYIIIWVISILNQLAGGGELQLIGVVAAFPLVLQGLFFFMLLLAVSEGLYILVDIAENTRQ